MARKLKDTSRVPARTLNGTPAAKGLRRPATKYVRQVVLPTGGIEYAITERGYEVIETLAREGRDIVTIASHLGMDKNTFRRIRQRDERAQTAIDQGRARLGDEITDILLDKARDGETTAAIFLAKGRLHWRDHGPIPGEAAQPNIVVTINAPMSDDEFARMVNIKQVPNDEPAD